MLISYEEVIRCDDDNYNKLMRMCRVVFKRHYSMYEQYFDEMSLNAITAVYEAVKQYNPEYSWVNYLYTVIRNSYTKDVNKYKKMFIRENDEFKNEISQCYSTPLINMKYEEIEPFIKRFNLNKKHKNYLLDTLKCNGINISGYKTENQIHNVNELDEDYIGRIVGMILYEYFEKYGGIV